MDAVATFSPDDDYRPVVRLVLDAADSLDPPLPEHRREDLRLAVTEACSNAAKVHRVDAAEDPVVVTCHLEGDRICVDVRDRGPGFDPDELEPLPEPTDPRRLEFEHGLGVPLIRTLADEVDFRSVPDGTIVSMEVARRPAQSIQ